MRKREVNLRSSFLEMTRYCKISIRFEKEVILNQKDLDSLELFNIRKSIHKALKMQKSFGITNKSTGLSEKKILPLQ